MAEPTRVDLTPEEVELAMQLAVTRATSLNRAETEVMTNLPGTRVANSLARKLMDAYRLAPGTEGGGDDG